MTRIAKVYDGSGGNFVVGEYGITKIYDITRDDFYRDGFYYPVFTPSPCFEIFKHDRLWKKVYLPRAIVEYEEE